MTSLIKPGLILAGFGLGLVILAFGGRPRSAAPEVDFARPARASAAETEKAGKPPDDPARRAAAREAAGDLEGALALQEKILAADPRSVAAQVKVAELLIALGRRKPALELLRGPARVDSLPQGLLDRIHTAMVRAHTAELSPVGKKAFREATHHLLAAEELRRSPQEERESRPWVRPSAVEYARAEGCLKAVLAESPDHMPALLSLGVVKENLASPKAAAEAYGSFLRLHALHGLPHGKEAGEVARRLRVCEARMRIATRFQALVPGTWKAFHAEPGQPWPADGTPVELLSDGTVKGRPECYWVVREDVLLVGGKKGASDEWADAGRLAPDGRSFEGLTLGTGRTKYVKQ